MDNIPARIVEAFLAGNSGPIPEALSSYLRQGTNSPSLSRWRPEYSVTDTADAVTIYVALAGIPVSMYTLTFKGNKAEIVGERVRPFDTTDLIAPSACPIQYGHFEITIPIPVSVVDPRSVSTKFDNGMLVVRVDKNIECQRHFVVNVAESTN